MSYKYDHRQLAEEMELYFFNDDIGAGLPVWLPNGAALREELEKFIKEKEFRAGYARVSSPHIARSSLYEKSGHLKFYRDDMYPPMEMEHQEFFLRPMNCPHHHMIFSSRPRSYRELPLRLAEYGQVYRKEASGALRGLSRVRGLCQNDGHIYVCGDQLSDEIKNVLKLHLECYRELGVDGFRFRLSKHAPASADFEGKRDDWIFAENILREALLSFHLPFYEEEGEAAFYGPKIDIQMKFFSEGKVREESMSSIQLDFLSPIRFDLSFINAAGKKERPYIIHRAPLGSHERFIAMLLEYFDGQLPFLLSPVQLLLFPINDEAMNLCLKMKDELADSGLRVQIDNRIGSSLAKRLVLGRKLRPFSYLIIGEKELNSGIASLHLRERQKEISLFQIESLAFNLNV